MTHEHLKTLRYSPKTLLVVGVVVGIALLIVGKAEAAMVSAPAEHGKRAPVSDANPRPTGPNSEGEDDSGESGDSGSDEYGGSDDAAGEENGGTSVTNIQSNEYFFDTTSWLDALLQTLTKDSTKSSRKLSPILKAAANQAFQFILDFDTDGLESVKGGKLVEPAQKIWKVSFGVALAIFPLVMVINIFLSYSQSDFRILRVQITSGGKRKPVTLFLELLRSNQVMLFPRRKSFQIDQKLKHKFFLAQNALSHG